MTGRGRGLSLAIGVAGTVLASCGGSPSAHAAPPLTDLAIGTADRTVASVAMGRLGDAQNTFWQLVTRTGSSPWAVITPPGVATNGGIAVALRSASTILAAVLPSQLFKFTALAQSSDAGRTWSPGVVQSALDKVPGSIGAGPGPGAVAFRSGSSGAVLVSRGSLFDWSTTATRASITASTPTCAFTELTAVGIGPSGALLVAGGCESSNAPIVERVGGHWSVVGPSLGAKSPLKVLRLVGTPTGAVALVEANTGARRSLVLMASTDRFATWRASWLALPKGTVASTSVTTSGAASVLISGAGGFDKAFSTRGPGLAWSSLPRPPNDTVLLTAETAGAVQALAVHLSVLTVFSPRGGRWVAVQRLVVPIQYGTSG